MKNSLLVGMVLLVSACGAATPSSSLKSSNPSATPVALRLDQTGILSGRATYVATVTLTGGEQREIACDETDKIDAKRFDCTGKGLVVEVLINAPTAGSTTTAVFGDGRADVWPADGRVDTTLDCHRAAGTASTRVTTCAR